MSDAEFEARLVEATRGLRAFVAGIAPRDVDDVAQEALTRAWQYRASWNPDHDLQPWLMKIALRVALERRRHVVPESFDALAHDLGERARDPVDREAIARQLDVLAPRLRDVVVRFHRDGEELRAIAGLYGVPVNTVKSWLYRARRKLAATCLAMACVIGAGMWLAGVDPPPARGRVITYEASFATITPTRVERTTKTLSGSSSTLRTRGVHGDVVTSTQEHETRRLR